MHAPLLPAPPTLDGAALVCHPVPRSAKCLRNRHGEDCAAAEASNGWWCPTCRGSCGAGCVGCCNCGLCRKKVGGEGHRHAGQQGGKGAQLLGGKPFIRCLFMQSSATAFGELSGPRRPGCSASVPSRQTTSLPVVGCMLKKALLVCGVLVQMGLEPTHQVVRLARDAGFDNVHDYLVHLVTGWCLAGWAWSADRPCRPCV